MKKGLISFFAVVALLAAASFFTRRAAQIPPQPEEQSTQSVWQTPEQLPQQTVETKTAGYAAMWISYLEWESVDFSTQDSFTAAVSAMITDCANLGVSHLIVQVRPFGDALYQSSLFPSSHLVTGTQGDALPYDPLQIIVTGAHAAGLKVEAWINPYRIQLTSEKPAQLSGDNPAVRWMADEATGNYVKQAGGGLYYDPGQPEVQQLIIDGVDEIVQNYAVDGIVFDDYFYPTTDPEFDAETFAEYGGQLSLDSWRRQNVNTLVQAVYRTVKQQNAGCSFGISPSGNIMNNLTQQYSDVISWLSQPGYLDYLAPQLYWGFDYRTQAGSDAFAFENVWNDWLNLPRCGQVQLYPVLGAYRIGDGDGSADQSTEWISGENLSRMARLLLEKTQGFSLYRYDFLYKNAAYSALAEKECAALRKILLQTQGQE